MRRIHVDPHASVLIESMRDIGYSLESALADVIDNSITAGATQIEVLADADAGRIAVLDDGSGMTETELIEAMRPGTRSPLEDRRSADLGRFGLGLKTASFSQCRRVTVLTRSGSQATAARWDLDLVADTNEWLVELLDAVDEVPWCELLDRQGTLVVWEKLDRVLGEGGTESTQSQFVERVDDAREHLELVFHRFLAGEVGIPKIRILINSRPLTPFDPFNTTHTATIIGPPEQIRVGQHLVSVRPYTLPHHSMVTPTVWQRYAGRAGYVKNQGFYVYRERRLIVYGTWFGLARQMELTKLARVQVDMPNGLDAEWKIDVKKASAQPPYQVRQRLRKIVEKLGAASKRVYKHRGTVLTSDIRIPVWIRVQDRDKIVYRLNTNHPLMTRFITSLSDEQRQTFEKLMEVAGSALPMDSLFADLGSDPEKVSGNPLSDDALRFAVDATCRHLRETGFPADDIVEMLRATEPFRSNWRRSEDLVRSLACGEILGA